MRKNPVFDIELKRNSRSMKCSLLVFIVNLLLLVVAIGSCFGIGGNEMYLNITQHKLPIQSYMVMGYTLFLMISFIVPGLSAGAISLERERKTMELLLVTPMSPWKIIYGKLESVVFIVFLIIISSLPIFGLLLVFGGISILDLMGMVLVLLMNGIYLASIGIFFSTLMKKTTRASIMTYVAIVFVVVGTIAFIALMHYILEIQRNNQNSYGEVSVGNWIYILLLNPFISFYGLLTSQVGSGNELIQICNVFGVYTDHMIVDHLFICSLIMQLLLSILCIYFSGKLLMPIKKAGKFAKSSI